MNTSRTPLAAIRAGTALGPFTLELSAAANERYWRAAGLTHPSLVGGALYPLIAANVTVLTWLERCAEPMIQTRQRLWVHDRAAVPARLTAVGSVTSREVRRQRDHLTLRVDITQSERPLWTSEVGFTPAATLGIATRDRPDRASGPEAGVSASPRAESPRLPGEVRRFTISDDLIRSYSRRGNYHSDARTAEQLGLPGLVAQGTQACGTAYGMLLDAWGERVLAGGALDLRFVGMVLGGDEVATTVAMHLDQARIEVWNTTRDRLAAVGTATR